MSDIYLTSLIKEVSCAAKKKQKTTSTAHGDAGLICADKLQATKVVITGVYTPINSHDKQ